MDKKTFWYVLVIMFLVVALFLSTMPLIDAGIEFSELETDLNFAGNDVDSHGVLWVGDKTFGLWKSVDDGVSFEFVYRLPGRFDPNNAYSGHVWNVFVDSRNFIFVSAGGTNGLYRSTNGGNSFTQVLNSNASRGESFYIDITEDQFGNLYTITYTDGSAQPQILRSTNGGSRWTKIGGAISNVLHFHNIAFNPSNGYIYVITGEIPPHSSYRDGEKIFRSKDNGETWTLVVDRNSTLGTVYLAMAFVDDYVYIGQDYPDRICQIHRFRDDGSNRPFTPQVVYTPPPDGAMPFMAGTYFNNTLAFANCAELQNGITRIITSTDGLTWTVIAASDITASEDRWNHFTINPRSGIIFGTLKPGSTYQIKANTQPTPIPEPPSTSIPDSPSTPIPTQSPPPQTPPLNPSIALSEIVHKPTPTPASKPTPTTIPAPSPTLTPSPVESTRPPSQTIPSYSSPPQASGSVNVTYAEMAIISMITAGSLLSVVLIKKHRHKPLQDKS